jgi:serine/threonine protein kinase/outer membrane protein assembly factor BamB
MLFAFLLLLLLCGSTSATAATATTASKGSGSRATALLSATGTSSLSDSTPSPLLICTLIDGSVIALDSESGQVSSLFQTGRELVANNQDHNLVVPDLEGNLYWKRTMQVLPVTIDDILQAPVQTCVEDDDDGGGRPNCGIVTGTKLTSLYGIDAASGKLVWTSHASSVPSAGDQPDNVVVLQREDYIVQQVSTATGHQVWNVTLGRFSALDFGAPKERISSSANSGNAKPLLLDDDGVEDEEDEFDTAAAATAAMNMPLIAFDGRGQVLNVLDTDTHEVVWRRQFPKVIARVYGLSDGVWVPLTVVDPNDGNDSDNEEGEEANISPPPLMLSLPSANDSNMMDDDKDVIYELLVRQQLLQTAKWQDKTLDVYHPPQQQFLPASDAQHQQQQESDFTAACILEGLCSSNAPSDDRQPFVKLPKGVEGNVPVMSPASYYANIPVVPPAPVVTTTTHQGVFLTWSMVAAIVMSLILVIVALFFMYQKKKEAWLTQANALTPVMRSSNSTALVVVESPPRLELERNVSAPMESMSMRSSYNNNQTSSTSMSITTTTSTALVKRTLSMPVFGDKSNHGSMDENDRPSSLEASQRLQSHQEQPPPQRVTRSPMLMSQPSNLNGVPLVLYSRYRSEFKEISSLGKGGFGSVFECENMLDGRKYAIKKVNVQVFENDEDLTNDRLQRVLREVKILAQLDNPNIVRYYTAWLEAEEVTTANDSSRQQESTLGDDDYTISKFPSKCYSSSLLLHSTTNNMDDERPSDMGRPPLPKKKASNPLGWNNDFTSDFSSQALSFGRHLGSVESLEDYGFHFDRQNSTTNNYDKPQGSSMNEHPTTNKSVTFHPQVDDDFSSSASTSTRENLAKTTEEDDTAPAAEDKGPKMRHILYIQMQLCRHRTLADFLGNPQARKALENGKGGSNNHHGIDIPYALTLFHQVAQGVQYVHSRDLIHRDLKPNNCFMDESGIVKVGDFGLSREGATNDLDGSLCSDSLNDDEEANANGLGGDNTAGVGTRSYASPEQIEGSDYDDSTDIFSLGFILFELCYPMYTGMERHMVFSRLRQREFPKDWRCGVAKNFPSLDVMLFTMLSPKPSDRPSAHIIVQKMEKLLSEFTVQSIDASLQENSLILLRVEAEPSDGVLAKTIKLIRESALGVSIDQYGLRGGETKAIIEFALSDTDHVGLNSILAALQACPEIKAARQVVSSKNHRRERSQSTSS